MDNQGLRKLYEVFYYQFRNGKNGLALKKFCDTLCCALLQNVFLNYLNNSPRTL